ncbi:RNB domain-containing ribonuclease [Aeromicrobium terrae]|uniref:RNB domain-containing ribonuclease n=1 Tax=Aeromicrobium terrae TaxID=2498846 RepID=A0A5C8NE23_9ACTN|nr:RNB domain-containing ribonuclease [Aeromicrobium terrae]TXL57231.1 RNB domain-containing ribonuclease [Aeromicrobium terrae]
MGSQDFSALRAELDLPPVERTSDFPADVEAEAERIAGEKPEAPLDLTDVPFVTIDPPGSMDLDQAVHLERRGDGFRVHYAIADVGAALPLGGPVDEEARRRGETIYLPDGRVPLHPPRLSEDALSLLPDQERRAVVWTIDVGADGKPGDVEVKRAVVRSVARLDYDEVMSAVGDGNAHPSIEALQDFGEARRAYRVAAGALELGIPEQVVVTSEDHWTIEWAHRTPADDWNAELSLLTGLVAGRMMVDAKVGILRTLPAPAAEDVTGFLKRAASMGVDVKDDDTAATVLARLDITVPAHVALMNDATVLLRGAGFHAFDGEDPEVVEHVGVGGAYAQVTAPLRRLADRFATEVCVALAAGEAVPDGIREALPTLPDIMRESGHQASAADRAAVAQVEAWQLADRVGDTFRALVVHTDGTETTVLLEDPSVLAPCTGQGLKEGETVDVRLAEVDVAAREVRFDVP